MWRAWTPSLSRAGNSVCTPPMPPHADQMSGVRFMLGWTRRMVRRNEVQRTVQQRLPQALHLLA